MFIFKVVGTLELHRVNYAIVGGFAVALHGAVRGTVDLDIVIQLSKRSFLALETAMKEVGLESRLPVGAQQVFDFREEYMANKNLVAWSFFNPSRPSEVVDVIITHDLTGMKTRTIEVMGHALKVLAVDDLIRMKMKSGRPQDLEDIKALNALKALKGVKK